MIFNLQNQVVALFRSKLAGVIKTPDTSIISGPPADTPRPMIAVYGGNFQILSKAGDFSSSQPRPREIAEEFPVDQGTPAGPYNLSKIPLTGTAIGQLTYNKGSLNERSRLILEKADFTIDYSGGSVTLLVDAKGASVLRVTYSFPATFFSEDFQQDFFIETLGPDMAVVEKIASLASTILFTNYDELIAGFNTTNPTQYSTADYLSEHRLGRLNWVDGQTVYAGNDSSVKMKFSVSSQIIHIRQTVSGFGLIEKVHSPGSSATPGINIEPGLG